MKIKNVNNNNMKELTQLKTPKNKTLKESEAVKAQGLPDKVDTKEAPSIKDSAKIDVSLAAQQMNKAKTIATPADDIDHAKVARLQKMIDEGNYKVDARSVADKLVDSHLLFGE